MEYNDKLIFIIINTFSGLKDPHTFILFCTNVVITFLILFSGYSVSSQGKSSAIEK